MSGWVPRTALRAADAGASKWVARVGLAAGAERWAGGSAGPHTTEERLFIGRSAEEAEAKRDSYEKRHRGVE